MWLLPLLLLTTILFRSEAESFVKRDEVITDEAEQTVKFTNAAEKFGEVTDALVGKDSPFKKLKQISKSLSHFAGPVGIAFGVGGALIQLLGPRVPSEVEFLGKQLNSRFDAVDRKLKIITSQIGSLPKRNQINAQIHKLDDKEETFLTPLYQKYKDVWRSKANKHSIKDFKEQCGRKKPYHLVHDLANAFALDQYRPGSASLFDDMIEVDYQKDLIEKIRDRLLFDLTRSILMIPLCGAAKGWDKKWIKNQVKWTTKKMKQSMEKINTKIYEAFYRDNYHLQFCFSKIAPYIGRGRSGYYCYDGFLQSKECEFRFIVRGKFLIPGTLDWVNLADHFQIDQDPVRTDGEETLHRFICINEHVNFDNNPKLYKALWKGTRIEYSLKVTELDYGNTDDDDVLIPNDGSQNGKVTITVNDSRSKLLSKLGATTDGESASTTWTCEADTRQEMCKTIAVNYQFRRTITINPKA